MAIARLVRSNGRWTIDAAFVPPRAGSTEASSNGMDPLSPKRYQRFRLEVILEPRSQGKRSGENKTVRFKAPAKDGPAQ
jgi:hypothetical protein